MLTSSSLIILMILHIIVTCQAGSIMPLPQSSVYDGNILSIDSQSFSFAIASAPSDLLQDACSRYSSMTFLQMPPTSPINTTLTPVTGSLLTLTISVASQDETLALNTSEKYTLIISSSGTATLSSDTVYGALRGLETFSQLVDFVSGTNFIIPCVAINDFPRFQHRGALIDTARHFLPVNTILMIIDALAYGKFNVLHWHIVDDQSFAYYSSAFPELSGMGAWNAPATTHVYSKNDVAKIIDYSKGRGIRVLPEYDTPGHSESWGLSQPGLLTQCYTNVSGIPVPVAGSFGPIDPTVETTWSFLSKFFAEVAQTFPDDFIHIGGDEVSYECWESNPLITQWMISNNIASYEALESYYVQKVINLITSLGKKVIGWQELIDNNLTLPEGTVVTAWKGGAAAGPAEMSKITSRGYGALLSAGWYENYISYGAQWPLYYPLDPMNMTSGGNDSLVMGGELCVWGEYVDSSNIIGRIFPYGNAIGERLWSAQSVQNISDAAIRLHSLRCRYLSRQIPCEVANGPSFCPVEYNPPYNPPF